MRQFLAIVDVPPAADPIHVRALLERLSRASDGLGVHPLESIVSVARGSAFTFFEAKDEESIARAHAVAGFPPPEVYPAERVYTDLLTEDHRAKTRSN